jgi:mono/diheme cytochrome c family protein
VKNESRTTGPSPGHHQDVTWPSSAQILRQLGIIALVVVLWGILLAGYLRVTGGSGSEPLAASTEPPQAMAAPTDTVPAPTDTVPPPTEAVAAPADTLPPPTEAVDTPTAESETPSTEEPSSPSAASFSEDVFPILESRCVQCHGPSRTSGGVRLDSYDAVMAVVVPGDAAASLLVEVVVTGDMPRRGPKLLPSEFETFSAWVSAGAPDN